jgi:hypothetical protein
MAGQDSEIAKDFFRQNHGRQAEKKRGFRWEVPQMEQKICTKIKNAMDQSSLSSTSAATAETTEETTATMTAIIMTRRPPASTINIFDPPFPEK